MSRRFKKIRIMAGKYTIVYDKECENGRWESHSLKSDELARPEFQTQMQILAYYFVDMCQLRIEHNDIPTDVTVIEVAYTYPSKKPPYLIIKGEAYLNNGHALYLSSPAWDIPTVHDNGRQWNFYNDLTKLEKEAWDYVDGKRAQGVLPFGQKDEEIENPLLDGDND